MGKTLKDFESTYEDEFLNLKKFKKQVAKDHNCLIKFKKKFILVETENPSNIHRTLTYKFKYRSGVQDEIFTLLDELDEKLCTFYYPLYLAVLPTIKLSLGNIIKEVNCCNFEVAVSYVDNDEPQIFGYNAAGYKRFIEHIMDIIQSTTVPLKIPDEH